jgi:hypothetical protein
MNESETETPTQQSSRYNESVAVNQTNAKGEPTYGLALEGER